MATIARSTGPLHVKAPRSSRGRACVLSGSAIGGKVPCPIHRDPLYQRDDVVTLPHVGGSTREAFARIAAVVVENVERRRRGEPLLHRLV